MLQLPAELVLAILSYLPLSSLIHLQLVSRAWKQYFDVNEVTIYRHAAAIHSWIPSFDMSIFDLTSLYSKKSLKGVDGWKSFCKCEVLDGDKFCVINATSKVKTVFKLNSNGPVKVHLASKHTQLPGTQSTVSKSMKRLDTLSPHPPRAAWK